MKKKILFLCVSIPFILLFALSCSEGEREQKTTHQEEETLSVYQQITPKEAKNIMDSENDFVILDVRTTEEFAEGHILGAVNLDYVEIEKKAEEVLPRKEQLILVYCRSGRRSKIAAEALVKMGYTNIKEFGGILDWPYEIVK